MIRFGLADCINAIKVAMNVFFARLNNPNEIIQEVVNLANIARKNGLIVLEQQPIEDKLALRSQQGKNYFGLVDYAKCQFKWWWPGFPC